MRHRTETAEVVTIKVGDYDVDILIKKRPAKRQAYWSRKSKLDLSKPKPPRK